MTIDTGKILTTLGIILAPALLMLKVNLKRRRRVRQLPLTLVSAVLMIVGVSLISRYLNLIIMIGNLFRLDVSAVVFIANAALLTAYTTLRNVLLPICHAVGKIKSVSDFMSLGFYKYDEEYDEWFLDTKWKNFRTYFFVICVVLSVVSALYLGWTWMMGSNNNPFFMRIYPCCVMAVMIEFFNYIDGQTKQEYEHSIYGDEADARKVRNYYKLRDVLEKLFPEPLLSAQTGYEYAQKETPVDLLNQLKDEEDINSRIVAEFFNAEDRYKTVDVDSVQATLDMLNRRNVIFLNPFYHDLSVYVALPLMASLLNGKKCAVICGRNNEAEDVIEWLQDTIKDYSHIRAMWRVNMLGEQSIDCEVGVLTFTQIYDKNVINANHDFFGLVDFVILLEPSLMLNTGQVALNIIAGEMQTDQRKPVYCICDRAADGLVDTMSHLLRDEITDVVAMPVPRCRYTTMLWNADSDYHRQSLFDRQTRFLGNGMELAAVAVKNQIPKVTWYSENKAPVKDIRWIAGKNYATICRYMNLPTQQKNLFDKIGFNSNIWSRKNSDEEFVIVEDEFYNMFAMMRTFMNRGKQQSFVNVMSENYLLRDYMRNNRQMFVSDPNAIPSLVPDYAKTERNTILKLVILMSMRQVTDEEVSKELHLIGIDSEDNFEVLARLLKKYSYADDSIFCVKAIKTAIDEFTTTSMNVYSIDTETFNTTFADTLKHAYYILEDEKDNEGYLDAKLFSHVSQTILPGQFVTYDGKYYMVKHMSPQSGVVLRRASDQYSSRKYYRQIRRYFFDSEENEIISSRTYGDVEITEFRADFHVDTTGYLDMKDSADLRNAKVVDLSADPTVGYYARKYHNKSMLRISMPGSDTKIRYTICMLLSEMFRTIYPSGWQYITATSRCPEDVDGMLNYLVYPLEGEYDDQYIYIIEDSDIDLGLLDSVSKNLMQLLEIVADFVEWHLEKMREPASKMPVAAENATVAEETSEEASEDVPDAKVDKKAKKAKKGLFGKLFGRKKKAEETEEEENPENIEPVEEDTLSEVNAAGAEQTEKVMSSDKNSAFEPAVTENPDLAATDGTDIFESEGMPDDDFLETQFETLGLSSADRTKYQKDCYLKFGFDEIDSRIGIEELMKFLRVRGWTNNSLTKARTREILAKTLIDMDAENTCDFCGLPLSGVSYDVLNDGRVRCNDCSCSAINKLDDFKELFLLVIGLMEDYFDIRYRVPISVCMTDAKTVAKGAGCVFRPTTAMAARCVGYAKRKGHNYSLMLENGSPRLATTETMAHELTHIWTYLNWDDKEQIKNFAMGSNACTAKALDILNEGMAVWVSIQYLYQIGESYYAAQQEAIYEQRQDVYGIGFRIFREAYPFVKDASVIVYSPFRTFPPVDPEVVKAAVKNDCQSDKCRC